MYVSAAPQAPAAGRPHPPASPAQSGNWHRYHYPIGIFLTLYGLTGLLSTLIGWSGHRKEIATYLTKTAGLGTGLATPVLVVLHVVETLLILITLAGLLRRRDVWFLPVLFGWMAGFAVFCALDVWAGTMGLLAEHAVYLAGFTVVLFLSYALGVKARVGRSRPPGRSRGEATPQNLSRTQELALSALNRWQRTAPPGHAPSAPGAPAPGPPGPGVPSAHGPAVPHPPRPAAAGPPGSAPAPAAAPPPAAPAPAPPATIPAPALPFDADRTRTDDPAPEPDAAPGPAPAAAPTPAPAPEPSPAPESAPAPASQEQQHAPLPPPRRFPVTPPTQRPPSS